VYGDARVSNLRQLICISGFPFHITITPQNAIIGCQMKTHEEWLKITRKEAVKLGLEIELYSVFQTLLKLGIKQVTK
jgi:hypothetical protein